MQRLMQHVFHHHSSSVNISMKAQDYRKLPLVYACSGCSSAAQAANYIALKLDRDGFAEMSCIAGVGGNVPHLVKIAQSGRPVIAIDGCPLACTRACLAQREVKADMHIFLQEHGVKKQYHADFDREHADSIASELGLQAQHLCAENAGSQQKNASEVKSDPLSAT